jgi:hypothetical protein
LDVFGVYPWADVWLPEPTPRIVRVAAGADIIPLKGLGIHGAEVAAVEVDRVA